MRHLLDLSRPLGPGTPVFPGDPPFTSAIVSDLAADGCRVASAALSTHCGTHVDAPAHVLATGELLEHLPLSRFAGPGVALDATRRAGRAVTAADLAPHLPFLMREHPAFVLLRTGDEELWGTAEYFGRGASLTPEAARLLAALPDLSGVGLDAAGVDPPGRELPAHRVLLGAGRLIVENLRGLAQLPPAGFAFVCLPLFGGEASPVRAAAFLD